MEEWRPVPGFERDYAVSSLGRVRRVTPARGARVGHILAAHITSSGGGYQQVALRRDGRTVSLLVCQLVCIAFHGPRPVGLVVRHKDGNSQNDTPENLSWGTHLENMQDMRRHGTHNNARKIKCKNGHAFTAENTAVRTDGGRACRECRRINSRRAKQVRRVRLTRAGAA